MGVNAANLNGIAIAKDDTAQTTANTPVNIQVLNNDKDLDDDALTLSIVSTASQGTVQINDNSTPNDKTDDFIIYTPNSNFTGIDKFTYQVSDGKGASAQAQVNVTINPAVIPTFKLSKIADDIFKISNSSGKSKIKVTLIQSSSNLVNELGVFTVDDAQGNINGIAPGAAGYTQAALKQSQVILSAIANLPNGFNTDNLTHLLEFNSGENLRFYLVKNSSIDAVRAGVTPLTEILFSDPLTQKITDLGNDDFSLAWKDGRTLAKVSCDIIRSFPIY